ncbi:hypothetical protein CROQUDRAFT_654989 [Cronartium quercuum f. sp. fusiforme G11]|uniref:Uncharacterized protein n=1 Tax=Cronartium quercuum f. sp. fusiforme G11 TaxID=708437 RepID=A0A9P6NRJ8_9BASI|nr:hypothetical protein CROQUDRAFT_654989 [Cronartium quercuum f. sp. fusiforme G11]
MQATFEDHKQTSEDISKNEADRLAKNEARREAGKPTEGGAAGRAQIGSKDPKDHDTKHGGQADHLPTTKPFI